MENQVSVMVIESFEMVVPGAVYPKRIEEGEVVSGRVAEVALQLGKGENLDPDAKEKSDKATEPAGAGGEGGEPKSGAESGSGVTAPSNKDEAGAPSSEGEDEQGGEEQADDKQGELLGAGASAAVIPGAKGPLSSDTAKAADKGSEDEADNAKGGSAK